MKKITLLFALATLCYYGIEAQSNFEKAQQYISTKGEVCFTFIAESESQFQEISEFLSIGHKVDRNSLKIEAYGTAESFRKFLEYGLSYTVNSSDNEFSPNNTDSYDSNAWDTSWNQYPTYSQYVNKLNYYANTYPNLCQLQSIGTTITGREILMLKISDNVNDNEAEPEFMYTSSMHGDELAGYPLMIRLIDYLLTNYNLDSEVTNIVNNTEIYINPLANPDGAYRSAGNNTITNPRRGNANNQDLNRNFPDNQNVNRINGHGSNTSRLHFSSINDKYEAETLAFMKFEESHNIVLSANFHGGTELVNYAFDNTHNQHSDHDWYEHVSVEYATHCQNNSPNGYMTIDEDSSTYPSSGVTNGAAWYVVYGGRQDYMNYYRHSKEVTIELSDEKWVNPSELPNLWNYNRQAFLDYMKQVNYGFQGRVTDESGNPIEAKVFIEGHDELNSWTTSNKDLGDYYRLIKSGTYNVTFKAPGYLDQEVTINVSDNSKTTKNIEMIASIASPVTENEIIASGEATTLQATGNGIINWYENIDDENPIYSGNNFTTPQLNESTSYYVEDAIVFPNAGSIDYNNNGNFVAAGDNERYLVFDSSERLMLNSVSINSENTGEIEIQLQDSSGNMLDARIVIIEDIGIQDIQLDFMIPADNNLRLVSKEMSNGFKLWRNNSGTNYPYNSGPISIKSSSGNNKYFFFYDWKIESLKSSRIEVVVEVEDALSLAENTLDQTTIYPNPFNNSVSINPPQTYLDSNMNVQLLDALGRQILDIKNVKPQNGTLSINNLDDLQKGSYFIKLTDLMTSESAIKKLIKS